MENFINKTSQPFTVITNDILQSKTIFKNSNQKLCYFYLYSLNNCTAVFPSQEKIAEAICCSVSSVKRTLRELQELGLLEVKSRPGFTSIYILNDYHGVVQNELGLEKEEQINPVLNEVGQNELAQNELGRQVKVNQGLGQNELVKLKDKNKITKNKISSSTYENIEEELRKKYPNANFEEIKKQILSDETLIIKTEKQYRSILEYRLSNYKPTKKKYKREEVVPEWFKKDSVPDEFEEEFIKEERERLKIELNSNRWL